MEKNLLDAALAKVSRHAFSKKFANEWATVTCEEKFMFAYTAMDGCHNVSTCTQVITWTVDTTPPVQQQYDPDYGGSEPARSQCRSREGWEAVGFFKDWHTNQAVLLKRRM